MLQKKNDNFLSECRNFHFAGCCEMCAHFDAGRSGCSFFWPNEAHLDRVMGGRAVEDLSFCKDFELN